MDVGIQKAQELVEELIKMDPGIRKAQERLEQVANDEKTLREYHMREMALSDWTSGVNHAREEGAKEIARRLKTRGRPLEEIAEDTGLDMETIRSL
jgi:predicted transposase/invertase (TIGR01784 family)